MSDEEETAIPAKMQAMFGVAGLHAVFFQPVEDDGAERDVVAIHVPEALPTEVAGAMRSANERRTRLLFLCDTEADARSAVAVVETCIPSFRRVSLERALHGGWGPPN